MGSQGKTIEFSPRIFGGTRIGIEDHLAKVTVGVFNKKLNEICTGTIIAENIILTAAHCVVDTNVRNIEVVFDKNVYAPIEKREKVSDLVVHDSYVHTDVIENDLALLKLKRSIQAGYEVIDLSRSLNLKLPEHTMVQVAGFGFSRVDSFRMGLGTLRKTEVKVDFYEPYEKLLILDQSENKGICSGDSGGGAFLEKNGELIQLGVNSFVYTRKDNPKKADCRIKAFLTNISYFHPWITESINTLVSR